MIPVFSGKVKARFENRSIQRSRTLKLFLDKAKKQSIIPLKGKDGDKVERESVIQRVPGWCEGHGGAA